MIGGNSLGSQGQRENPRLDSNLDTHRGMSTLGGTRFWRLRLGDCRFPPACCVQSHEEYRKIIYNASKLVN